VSTHTYEEHNNSVDIGSLEPLFGSHSKVGNNHNASTMHASGTIAGSHTGVPMQSSNIVVGGGSGILGGNQHLKLG
jgi:hypothetical protein